MDEHYGLKRLIAYRQGRLPAAEREAVQEHLSLCPRCTGLLRELRDFEAAAESGDAGPEPLRQEAWSSLLQRLPVKTPKVRAIGGGRRETQPWRVPRFVAGAAAALLLASTGLALWSAVTVLRERQRLTQVEQRLEQRDAALAALQSSLAEAERQLAAARGQIQDLEKERIDRSADRAAAAAGRGHPALQQIAVAVAPRFALRGQEAPAAGLLRGGGAVNPVRATDDGFAVTLSLADHPAYEEYRFELLDRDGKVLWNGGRPARSVLGDAGTSVSFTGLGTGRYRLRIAGLRQGRAELLDEYVLDVQR